MPRPSTKNTVAREKTTALPTPATPPVGQSVHRGQAPTDRNEHTDAAREVDMKHSMTRLAGISHSTFGKLLRALLAAQQFSSFSQVPALKALSTVGGQSELVRRVGLPAADPAIARLGHPVGPAVYRPVGGCDSGSWSPGRRVEKYHGNSHAGYCGGRPVSEPWTPSDWFH